MSSPLPSFADAPRAARAAVTRVYFDIDDTLTWRGRLPAVAVGALDDARALGLSLVAVTGRSAAWGELFVRLFPLDGVIAETGALAFYPRPEGGIGVLHSEPDARIRSENAATRARLADAIVREMPGARLALDNLGRLYDTAFDLVEDGPPVPAATAASIRARLEGEGLTVAQSSVHINAWFGDFDKATMVDRFLRAREGCSLDEARDTLVYVGDSTNDGAMFARTPLSVGVANVAPHLDRLESLGQAPRYGVAASGGFGFAEVVAALRAAR